MERPKWFGITSISNHFREMSAQGITAGQLRPRLMTTTTSDFVGSIGDHWGCMSMCARAVRFRKGPSETNVAQGTLFEQASYLGGQLFCGGNRAMEIDSDARKVS